MRVDIGNNAAWYSIMPANVRYDNEIPDKAKMFFLEITAHMHGGGWCEYGIEYFTDILDVTEEEVRDWFAQMEKRGYVETGEMGIRAITDPYTAMVKQGGPNGK